MRIALITLALVALGFIGTIIYIMVMRDGGMITLPKVAKNTTTESPEIAIETLKYQIKTEQKLDELTKKVEALGGSTSDTMHVTGSMNTKEDSATGSEMIPISGKFLAQVMPTLEFSLIENNGIYELHIFDLATKYSTYSDIKY